MRLLHIQAAQFGFIPPTEVVVLPKYDIAISFAGEDRPIAERLASLLVTQGLNVFYDAYEQPNLWGK